MAQTRTLITGGVGFIGSHLVDYLLSRGDQVVVLDDLSTGCVENLDHLGSEANLELAIGSITDEKHVASLVKTCDRVFHLAAGVGVRLLADNPVEMLETNVRGTAIVLRCCAQAGTPVLIASSSEVYGKSRALPQHESADLTLGPPTELRWSYACSKAIGEHLALAYHRTESLPVVVVRFFNTVGPRQRGRYGMVIPRFLAQAEAGAPITVYGDGSQTRCFCHVIDSVHAATALLENPESFGQTVNLGSQRRVTIDTLARLVKEMTASASEIVYVPFETVYHAGLEDMQDREPEIELLVELTGIRPSGDLKRILADTIADWRRTRPL